MTTALGPTTSRFLTLESCIVDLGARTVRAGTEERTLTGTEAKLLGYLSAQDGRAVPPEELLREVWGYRGGVISRTVKTTVGRLREKIERVPGEPTHVLTVSGSGYRFVAQTRAPAPVTQASTPEPKSPPPPAVTTTNLPRALPLVGREALVEPLIARAADGNTIPTIVGPAGIGKSAMLLHLGHRALSMGRWKEVLRADLHGATDVDAVVRALLQATDVDAGPGSSERVARRVAAALQGRGPVLLLLDHAEGAAAPLSSLIGAGALTGSGLSLAVASREPLGLPGEWVVPLSPLSPNDALALFRLRLAPPLPTGYDDDARVAPALVPLDGLPLALELAAGLASLLPPERLAEQLRAPLDLVADGGLGRPSRHRDLRAAIASSWDALDEAERDAVSQLATFSSPWTLEDGAAVLAPRDGSAALPMVRRLQRRGLIRIEDVQDAPRLRLFAAVRAFAAERGPHPEALLRHRSWYARLGSDSNLDAVAAGRSPSVLLALRASADEIRSALLGTDRGSPERWPLARALLRRVLEEGPLESEEAALAPLDTEAAGTDSAEAFILDRAAWRRAAGLPALARTPDAGGQSRLLARAWIEHAWSALAVDVGTAAEAAETALQHADASDDLTLMAEAREVAGVASYRSGSADDAEGRWLEARKLYQRAGHLRGEASALGHLAALHRDRGRPIRARDCYVGALDLCRRTGDLRTAAVLGLGLGRLEQLSSRPSAAREQIERSAGLARRTGQVPILAEALCDMAQAALDSGDLLSAPPHVDEALQLAQRAALPQARARALQILADLDVRHGLLPRARARAEEALTLARSLRDRTLEGLCTATLGAVEAASGDLDSARAHFSKADALLATGRQRMARLDLFDRWIDAEAAAGNLDAAEELTVRAQGVAELSVLDMPFGPDGR